MQEYVEDNPITFNDIPRVMSDILKKCDLLEQSIEILHEEIRQSNQKSPSEHIPMDVKEACEFLKIKKSLLSLYISYARSRSGLLALGINRHLPFSLCITKALIVK